MASKVVPVLKLSSGWTIPQLGLGTWLSNPGEVGAAIEDAIQLGYWHFYCTQAYCNQKEIGTRFKTALVEGNADSDQIRYSDVDYVVTWKAMEEAVKEGKIRSIGLSKFNSQQIQRIWDHAIVKPSVVQVECHPYVAQRKLESFCLEKNIVLTAYSPFTNPGSILRKEGDGTPCVLHDPIIHSIADSFKKSPAQVILRWFIQRGIVVIPKSINRVRLQENFDIFNFKLTENEMGQINALDRNYRMIKLERDQAHKYFPFKDEFQAIL